MKNACSFPRKANSVDDKWDQGISNLNLLSGQSNAGGLGTKFWILMIFKPFFSFLQIKFHPGNHIYNISIREALGIQETTVILVLPHMPSMPPFSGPSNPKVPWNTV